MPPVVRVHVHGHFDRPLVRGPRSEGAGVGVTCDGAVDLAYKPRGLRQSGANARLELFNRRRFQLERDSRLANDGGVDDQHRLGVGLGCKPDFGFFIHVSSPYVTLVLIVTTVTEVIQMVTPKQLGHLVIRVRDLEKSEQFYTNVLGLKVMNKRPGVMTFMSADEGMSHELALVPVAEDAPGPETHQGWTLSHGMGDAVVSKTSNSSTRSSGRTTSRSRTLATTASHSGCISATRTEMRSKLTTKCPRTSGP